jgi:hypothetical protein
LYVKALKPLLKIPLEILPIVVFVYLEKRGITALSPMDDEAFDCPLPKPPNRWKTRF